jgi:type IV secretion system protein VirB11
MTQATSIEQNGGRLVLARYLEPLNRYLADESLTEIVVNRPGEVFVEGPEGWSRHAEAALTYDYLSHLATSAARSWCRRPSRPVWSASRSVSRRN